jgi:ribosomal protein S6--L-glutamate ligase
MAKNILILSDSEQPELIAAAKKLGHKAVRVPVGAIGLGIASTPKGFDRIYMTDADYKQYVDEPDFEVDCVLCRGGLKGLHGLAVVRHFEENLQIACSHNAEGIANCTSQLATLQKLSSAKIRIPETRFIYTNDLLVSMVDSLGGLPLIVKALFGSQGKGVFSIKDNEALFWAFQSFQNAEMPIILQRKIETEKTKDGRTNDIRIWIVGGQFCTAMRRYSNPDDFRANASISGKCEYYEPSEEEIAMAIAAANAVGLGDSIVGVDVMKDDTHTYVIECNSNPGTTYIKTVSKIDVFEAMINFITNKAKNKPKKIRVFNATSASNKLHLGLKYDLLTAKLNFNKKEAIF